MVPEGRHDLLEDPLAHGPIPPPVRIDQHAARAILAGIAAAVGMSRMLLGVHWFTDVVAGLAIGWAWFPLCAIATGGRLLRFGRPAQTDTDMPTRHRTRSTLARQNR